MIFLALALVLPVDLPSVDLKEFQPRVAGVEIKREASRLALTWPSEIGTTDTTTLTLDLAGDRRLIDSITRGKEGEVRPPLVREVDPVVFITVGTRENPPGRPPRMSVFDSFFDTPANRPHQSHRGTLQLKTVKVVTEGWRATLTVGDLEVGPFRGVWKFTVFRGSPLVMLEAVVRTDREKTAFLYDAGLMGSSPVSPRLAYTDTEGRFQRISTKADAKSTPMSVRHRAVVAESAYGSLSLFPPPHRYFFPRDRTDNLRHIWFGREHRGLADGWGLGIRQAELGGGSFVPWFNAPPATDQHLGMFLLPSTESAEAASAEVLRYTRGDRFEDVPGYTTFSSHWHMAITADAMARKQKEYIPDWVRMFKEMNVRIVHLGEFHGDGHPGDPGPLRLAEMRAMFDECKRLSDDRLLVLPGEEANAYLGLPGPGRHPGHYMLLFPKPVTWVMKRAAQEPFESDDPKHGKVYRVGSLEEMQRLIEREGGLAWTAHPRIKASNWTPDIFKDEPFYKAGTWLGAAWKAMPADLSRERLGDRGLDLLSDMANWGDRKYMPGEVDVFKVDHTHELFGHMNINYLKLDTVPRFDQGWKPVLDALRAGRFWVSTGEVLIPSFSLGGQESGSAATVGGDGRLRLDARLEWTFPLAFVEVVSGDGTRVYRDRVTLPEAISFGSVRLELYPELKGRSWARLEAWDVAGNGAFTQPVWLEQR